QPAFYCRDYVLRAHTASFYAMRDPAPSRDNTNIRQLRQSWKEKQMLNRNLFRRFLICGSIGKIQPPR
ncbi:hypothetical protein, partial [Burkholderia sp. WSM2232]|uniref:hypothetical protein n=1 Tax=Burkholderia sp. WSM2232 TaxID=944436 RepID=UPI001E469AF5